MNTTILTTEQVLKYLPQRYPFVFVDRVVAFEKGVRLVATKNITANEWPLGTYGASPDTSHPSPDGASRFTCDASQAMFPRALLIESAAQAALLFYQLSMLKEGERRRYFIGRVKAEFFDDAQVGDEIRIRVGQGRMLPTGGYSDVTIAVQEKTIATLVLFYSVMGSMDQ